MKAKARVDLEVIVNRWWEAAHSMKPYPVDENGYCKCHCYSCLVHGEQIHRFRIQENSHAK